MAPMRLILACTLLAGLWPFLSAAAEENGLAAVFDGSYLKGTPPDEEVQNLLRRIREEGEAYLRQLGQDSGFNGLYFRGEGWKDLGASDYGYRYGIDLELFDNGRYEGRRDQAKRVVESRIRYWQLLEDMTRRALDEQRHNLHAIRMRLKRRWLKARLKLLNEQLAKARAEFKAGFMVRETFNDYLQRQSEAELKLESMKAVRDTAVPPPWMELLNRAQSLQPLALQELLERARRQNYQLKLQGEFRERAVFQRDWKDDLEARIFIEKRRGEGYGQDDLVVGFRTRVPLDRVPDRDSLVGLEQKVHEEQARAIRQRIRQRMEEQLQLLRQHQAGLRARLDQLRDLEQRIRSERKHARLVVASLAYTPEKKLRVMARQRLDLLHDILEMRLQVLEYLINLAELTGDRGPAHVVSDSGG